MRKVEQALRSEISITNAILAASSPKIFGLRAQQHGHIVIDGVSLRLDSVVNQAFFAAEQVAALRDDFIHNAPFPHVVCDGLFSPRLLELMDGDFDRLNWTDWRRYDNSNEKKRGTSPGTHFGPASQLYFDTIHSYQFVSFIEKVSGIRGLLPDPALYSGGLHESRTGGRFAVHVDFNRHSVTKLDNRLAFITYLNKDWRANYGGSLELWSLDENKCVAEVLPVFGRSVLFFQSPKSLHGHPEPVAAPDGRPRRSASAYYYSNGRSDEDGTIQHSTLYPIAAKPAEDERLSNAMKYLLPPVLVDGVRRVKSLLR